MAHRYKFGTIKKDILLNPRIKLKGIQKENLLEKNVPDFLTKFFSTYNNTVDTVYVSNGARHTVMGRRRTIEDIFMVTHYYFPRVSLTKLYKTLTHLLNNELIVSSVCANIYKRVYRGKHAYDPSSFFNGPMIDEYGVDFTCFDLSKCAINEVGWGVGYSEDNISFKIIVDD